MSGRHLEDRGIDLGERGRLLSRFMASVYVDRPEMLLDPRCSPWLASDLSFMPPTLMITAEYCFLRDQDEAYAERLEAAGVATRVIRYNGLNHAFVDKVGVWPYAEGCVDDIAEARGGSGARETARNTSSRENRNASSSRRSRRDLHRAQSAPRTRARPDARGEDPGVGVETLSGRWRR